MIDPYQDRLLGLQRAQVLLQHLEVAIVIAAAPGLSQRVDDVYLPRQVGMVVPAKPSTTFLLTDAAPGWRDDLQ